MGISFSSGVQVKVIRMIVHNCSIIEAIILNDLYNLETNERSFKKLFRASPKQNA